MNTNKNVELLSCSETLTAGVDVEFEAGMKAFGEGRALASCPIEYASRSDDMNSNWGLGWRHARQLERNSKRRMMSVVVF